jgi:DNA-binding CsgD family transcriptional regulator
MIDELDTESNLESVTRRRAVEHWLLRGLTSAAIARQLREFEDDVRAEVGAIWTRWTEDYGSIDVATCLATYLELDRLNQALAGLPVISPTTKCQAIRRAALAREGHLWLRDRVGALQQAPWRNRLPFADECRQIVKLIERGMADIDPPPQPPDPAVDRREVVRRRLAHGHSTRQIAQTLHLAESLVRADVGDIHAEWEQEYGSIAAGALMVYSLNTTAEMLLATDRARLSTRDSSQFLQAALEACQRATKLLDAAGVLERVQKRRTTVRLTVEEFERYREMYARVKAERRNKPLYHPPPTT